MLDWLLRRLEATGIGIGIRPYDGYAAIAERAAAALMLESATWAAGADHRIKAAGQRRLVTGLGPRWPTT